MTDQQIDAEAARRYHAAAPCHPTWDQLGETTKSVWREKVLADLYGELA